MSFLSLVWVFFLVDACVKDCALLVHVHLYTRTETHVRTSTHVILRKILKTPLIFLIQSSSPISKELS